MEQYDFLDESHDILKAYYKDEDIYLDEDGKHIIFRFVRGRVVPIHVDSSDYVDWLKDQGIPIDNSSQENMNRAEEILDTLDKIREMSGPDAAAAYEKQIVEQYKQYFEQANSLGYEQVMDQRAQAQGTTRQELQKKYKQMYQDNKDNLVVASKDRVGEWGHFIADYTDKMLKNYPDQEVGSASWAVTSAFDLALMLGLEQAKKGTPPSQVDLLALLQQEFKTRDASSKYFKSRYAPEDMSKYNKAVISLVDGIESLLQNVERDTDFGKAADSAFERMYVKMFNDFDKPNQRNIAPMASSAIPEISDGVPDDLPERFTNQEASRLFSMYSSATGNKLTYAHKVMIHTLARLWDSIPPERQMEVFSALNDPDKGIHKIHKIYFVRAYQDSSVGLVDTSPDKAVEEALRSGLSSASSSNIQETIRSIKEIAARMAQLDGQYAYKNNKGGSARDIGMFWNDSPTLAGRAKSKGEGPNLMQFFSDADAHSAAIIPNSALKVMHNTSKKISSQEMIEHTQAAPEMPGTSFPDADSPSDTETSQQVWEQQGRVYVDKASGWKVEMIPKNNVSGLSGIALKVYSPKGQVIDSPDEITTHKKTKEQIRDEVIGAARKAMATTGEVSQSTKSNTPEVKEPVAAPPTPRSTEGDIEKAKVLNEIIRSLEGRGVSASKIKTNTYSIKGDDGNSYLVTIDKNGNLILHMKNGQGRTEQIMLNSADQALDLISAKGRGAIPSMNENNPNKLKDALGGVNQGQLDELSELTKQLEAQGLQVKAYPSTKRIVITNPNNPEAGKIYISNVDGNLAINASDSNGEMEEVQLTELKLFAEKLL